MSPIKCPYLTWDGIFSCEGIGKYKILPEAYETAAKWLQLKPEEISNIKRGVIWNLTINSGNFESIINQILETHILYNPLTYECYEIS